jgi:hypothetical protein
MVGAPYQATNPSSVSYESQSRATTTNVPGPGRDAGTRYSRRYGALAALMSASWNTLSWPRTNEFVTTRLS